MLSNEYASEAITVSNTSAEDLALAVRAKAGAAVTDHIKLREVRFVRSTNGYEVGDALPLLNDGKLTTPAGATGQLWIQIVPGKGLPAGKHLVTIRLTDADSGRNKVHNPGRISNPRRCGNHATCLVFQSPSYCIVCSGNQPDFQPCDRQSLS